MPPQGPRPTHWPSSPVGQDLGVVGPSFLICDTGAGTLSWDQGILANVAAKLISVRGFYSSKRVQWKMFGPVGVSISEQRENVVNVTE